MQTLSNTIPAAESGLAVDITYEITGETVRVIPHIPLVHSYVDTAVKKRSGTLSLLK